MRFTKSLCGALASLLFAAACADTRTTSSALTAGGGGGGDCTLTQGYWKNHESAWPVGSLELGDNTYSKAELLEILRTPVRGNGLISLAHQLIAAKLNVAAGADDDAIASVLAEADAAIGSLVVGVGFIAPREVSELIDKLDAFNNGKIGPGHCENGPPCNGSECDDDDGGDDCDHDDDGDCDHDCDQDDDGHCDGDESPAAVCGNSKLELGEACDDGNTVAHDGCGPTCQIEIPLCGNGIVEIGEECDDGNVVSGDGCSLCICDCPPEGH